MTDIHEELTADSATQGAPLQQRCPCLLLLDTSASMAGEPINQLNEALRGFIQDLIADRLAAERVELAIVSFGPVRIERDFETVHTFQPLTLTASGDTPLGSAIETGLELLHRREQVYRQLGIARLRPIVLLITDGRPTDSWIRAASLIHVGEAARSFSFIAIGVQGADVDALGRIAVNAPLSLQGFRFRHLFMWLSTSLSARLRPGASDQLPIVLPAWDSGLDRIPEQPARTNQAEDIHRPVRPPWTNVSLQNSDETADEAKADAKTDEVDCSVFAPSLVAPNEQFMVQVFAHLPAHAGLAASLAHEFDLDAGRRGFCSLMVDVQPGEALSFQLSGPGLSVRPATQSLRWRRRPESVQFAVTVMTNERVPAIVGTVIVGINGAPIGHIKFKVPIASEKPSASDVSRSAAGELAHFYEKVFVSYASADRTEVLKRLQLLPRFHAEIFQDVLNLNPGEYWERVLYQHIDQCDLFLLFWSTAARESEWVRHEIRYALERKGGDELAAPQIIPVPIEGSPPVPPPPELAHLHFNDRILFYMK
jgi:uncharacterized protein YegL